MKKCQNCGTDNEDTARYCASCGMLIQNTNPQQNNMNQQNYNKQNTYQQQNPYQNTPNRQNKNMYLAVLLDLIPGFILYILTGLGQMYLGLTKRGLVLCGCGLLVTLLNLVFISMFGENGPIIGLVLGLALVIYSAYDAYLCTEAINNNQQLPLLFGKYNFE